MTGVMKPGESLKYHVEYEEIIPESVLGQILSLIRPESRILELGCATGSMTRILKSHGCRVDAIELDGIAAQQARPYCERLLVADLETISWDSPFFAGETYDHVLIADVLEHMHDPARILRGIRGLVRADGNIVISTPNIGYAGVQAALQLGWFPYSKTGLLDRGHVHFFTLFELEVLLLNCGLVPVAHRAVLWGPGDSEFGTFWNRLTPEEQQHLLSAMDAQVYQWVVAAELPSDAAWRRCVLLASRHSEQQQRLIEQLSEHIAALQQELDDTRRRMEETINRGRALERDLQAVLSSTSWRLTAPIRVGRQLLSHVRFNTGKVLTSLRTQGIRATVRRVVNRILRHPLLPVRTSTGTVTSELLAGDWSAYHTWLDTYEILPADGAERVASVVQNQGPWPTVGIVMPLFNPNIEWLYQAIESVRKQWYPYWRLYLVDDRSTQQRAKLTALLERLVEQDQRIQVIWREHNGHISAATNDGLALSNDDWVTFLDQDDFLAPHALWCVAQTIRQHPQARIIYSDEDKIDEQGRRCEPHFKPDWNPDLFLSYNYICHLAVFRREDIVAVGGLRLGYEGAQDYDLALRVIERCIPDEIIHVPRILYHWRKHRNSTAQDVSAKSYAIEAGRRALQDAMKRRGVSASVTVERQFYRVTYHIVGSQPHVTIVVPTRNGGRFLKKCIDSVITQTNYDSYDIVIIDNGSNQPDTLRLLQSYAEHPLCTVVHDPRPFNYAALHNAVVPRVNGDYLLLLNDDIEVKTPDWLREMVSIALQPGVGIVGARLLFPNNTVQHGGVILVGGVAGHAHKHLPADHPGYMMRAQVRQTLSAVTGACLLVSKAVYQQVGGMDEQLAVAFNDVALCLAVKQAGYRIVWTPYAELYHHESATRGYDHEDPVKQRRFETEVCYMHERWGELLKEDPALNPNLDNMREDFALARPPRLPPLF